MADQLERNTRAPNPDVENDDPLAELARIIGYERPEEQGAVAEEAASETDSSAFDLESELMRELDVLPLDSFDELDEGEVSQPVQSAGPVEVADPVDVPGDVSAENPPLDDTFEFDSSWLDNKPDESVDVAPGGSSPGGSSDVPDGEVAGPETVDVVAGEESNIDLDLDGWDAVEADIARDDEVSDPVPFEPSPVANQTPQDVAQVPELTSTDVSDDDVLADIFKYELPNHDAGSQSAPVVSTEPAADENQAGQDSIAPPVPDSASGLATDEHVDWPGAEAEPVFGVDADEVEIANNAGVDGKQSDDLPADIDFEDYLSAELDVFGQQVAIGPSDDVPLGVDELQIYQSDTSTSSAEPELVVTDEDIPLEVPAAADRDAQPDAPYTLEDDFLFDEAAEDLLADFAQDEAIARAGLEDELVAGNLEAGISEEMREELEDLPIAPEPGPVAGPVDVDAGSELEFDLEQVLAEAVIDPNAAGEDLSAHYSEAAVSIAGSGASLGAADAYEFEPEPDEMAEAFKDLMVGESLSNHSDATALDDRDTQNNPQTVHGAEAEDNDWLSGFEAEPAIADAVGSRTAADDGFYFDADMITEPDETVETVGDIDVPDLPDNQPQMVVRDFDNDIEREFAEILDPEIVPADERPLRASVGGLGAATMAEPDWGQDANAAVRREASDDYAALERELSDGDIHVSPPYDDAVSGEHTAETLDGEYASGLHSAKASEQNGSRGPVVALAVLGLAVLAGVGAFGWSMVTGGEGADDDGPRIIRADKEPVKVLPENPGGATVPNQNKAVYDRVAGGDGVQSGQPSLVNTAEEPVDVVQRTLDPSVLPLEGRGELPNVKSEERLTADGGSDVAVGAGTGTPVVSPRRVRTMVVRPDGSIVAREDPEPEVAQTQTEIVPQPSETAAGTVEVAPETEEAVEAAQTTPADSDVAATNTQVQPAGEGTVAPVRVVTTQPIRAPVPQGRPAEQPVNVIGTVTQGGNVAAPAATAPAAPTQPVEVASAASAPVANPGGYYVQIASQPTAEGAQASWQTLSNRYSSVLGGRSVDIQRADIPGKGIFHRVRIPAGERSEANALCNRYKAAGGSCFVSR
ncbi:SPOR domain-containing protein [Hoeflea sp.]|uniref:SPOR domain-containing protein n=1 Tax=Hoeflea sp. TaxID=1940281 RepID=UPI003748E01F